MKSMLKLPDPEALLDEARVSRGLSDFGVGDLAGDLGRLLDCVEREGMLNDTATDQLLAQIRGRLVNRLEIEAWYKAHPDLAAIDVGPIVSITGLPRTGTTALVNIMSLDPQFRPLRTWEQAKPCPPPVLGEELHDPRRLAAIASRDRRARENPEYMAMHLVDVDATEEDVELLGLTFHAQQFAMPVFSYHAWWRNADLRAAFAYHRRVLRLLQSHRPPNRWLLKAPAHIFHLDALFSAYPDTRVIMTHRDPAKVVPSVVSLVSTIQSTAGKVDAEALGRNCAEHFRVGTERAMTARARIGEDRFFDLNHVDFVADPFGSLQKIYDFLDLPLTRETRTRMETWHAENRSGAHGVHRYTAEQFGLSASRLRSDFGAYIERYDVPLDG